MSEFLELWAFGCFFTAGVAITVHLFGFPLAEWWAYIALGVVVSVLAEVAKFAEGKR